MVVLSANKESIEKAARTIISGGIVAMPTETVYGLAGNAFDSKAVAAIYKAKQRPSFNPLIVHVSGLGMAEDLAEFNERAFCLAKQYWPGPLTLILPRKQDAKLSDLATAGLDTLALRCPDHPVAQALIRSANTPLVAPSANKSGTVTPTTPIAVQESLGDNVDIILAAGKTSVGVESTIVDCTTEYATILRPGCVTQADLEKCLQEKVVFYNPTSNSAPNAPGQLSRHYATNTPLRLDAVDVKKGEALLAFGSIKFMACDGYGGVKDMPDDLCMNLSESGDLEEAAANLFTMMRMLDKKRARGIAVMAIPEIGIGRAINDRLRRAAVPKSNT
jgi:L-threonylcarbamoyladenylate synthase